MRRLSGQLEYAVEVVRGLAGQGRQCESAFPAGLTGLRAEGRHQLASRLREHGRRCRDRAPARSDQTARPGRRTRPSGAVAAAASSALLENPTRVEVLRASDIEHDGGRGAGACSGWWRCWLRRWSGSRGAASSAAADAARASPTPAPRRTRGRACIPEGAPPPRGHRGAGPAGRLGRAGDGSSLHPLQAAPRLSAHLLLPTKVAATGENAERGQERRASRPDRRPIGPTAGDRDGDGAADRR